MTYTETIEYLYAQLPMFSRTGAAAYKADLHNTIALCNFLNNPQQYFTTIHIAGTNGKGSTSHMLAAILQQAGYKTGLYTSPHLVDFRERIKINGEMISEDFITQFVAKTRTLSESIEPSFFELTVAMAFEYFAQQQVDIAVIETGLGGRLDSTNIITPILSVITNIGWDHMNLLGDTLPKIAFEKAGIIKPKIPVVIGEYIDATKPVFEEKAAAENAPVFYAADLYTVDSIVPQSTRLTFNVQEIASGKQWHIETDLNGLYQVKNIRTVLAAVEQIKQLGFHLTDNTVLSALKKVKPLTGLMGRWDVVAENPTIVIDVAHNEDGMKQVLHQIEVAPPQGKVHFVMGMVKDKDVQKVLALLPATALYYFSQAHIPRAMETADLQALAATYHLTGDTYLDVNMALKAAQSNAQPNDMIIVCGSVFLAGEVDVRLLQKNSPTA